MPFGEPKIREDHHGKWLCFPVNTEPALQAFLPTDLATQQQVSIFWLGWGSLATISRYIGYFVDRNDYKIRAQFSAPYGVSVFNFADRDHGEVELPSKVFDEIAPRETALLSATLENGRSSEGFVTRLYLWAAIDPSSPRNAGDDETREVGVNITLEDWRKPRIIDLLGQLVSETSSAGIERYDLADLNSQVIERAEQYIQDRRLPE